MSDSADEARPEEHKQVAAIAAADTSAIDTAAARVPQVGPYRLLLLWLLLAIVISTAISWQLVERFHKTFQLPPEVTAGLGSTLSPQQRAAIEGALPARDIKNFALTVGLFGAATSLCFGVAAGLGLRSQAAIMAGILGGFLCGALAGAAGGAVEYLTEKPLKSLTALEPEHRIILGHMAGWAIAGLGIGLGASLSSRCGKTICRALIAAFAGGLIGGALHVPLVSILVPIADTEQRIPDVSVAILIWVALPTLCMALGLWRALGRPHESRLAVAASG
jgi:hypothetical protein